MKEYRNNKGYEVKETGRYRRTCFVDTEFNRILYIENLEDRSYDCIRLVTLGDKDHKPMVNNIYRYNDNDYVEQVVNSFTRQ